MKHFIGRKTLSSCFVATKNIFIIINKQMMEDDCVVNSVLFYSRTSSSRG